MSTGIPEDVIVWKEGGIEHRLRRLETKVAENYSGGAVSGARVIPVVVLFGTTETPPDPAGLPDGSLYIRYVE